MAAGRRISMVYMSDRPTKHAAGAAAEPAMSERVDETRLAMMRRVKRMTLEERIALFERLQRDAAWARRARRIR
jgi:hypothetical protein